jgi:hypothetical protein
LRYFGKSDASCGYIRICRALQLYKIITRSGLLDARGMELPEEGAGLFIYFLIGFLADI